MNKDTFYGYLLGRNFREKYARKMTEYLWYELTDEHELSKDELISCLCGTIFEYAKLPKI